MNKNQEVKSIDYKANQKVVKINWMKISIITIVVIFILLLVSTGLYFLFRPTPKVKIEGVKYTDSKGIISQLEEDKNDGEYGTMRIVWFGAKDCPYCEESIYGTAAEGESLNTKETNGEWARYAQENSYMVLMDETKKIDQAKEEIDDVFINYLLKEQTSALDFFIFNGMSATEIIGSEPSDIPKGLVTYDEYNENLIIDLGTTTTSEDGTTTETTTSFGVPFFGWFIDGSLVAVDIGYDSTYDSTTETNYDRYDAITTKMEEIYKLPSS